MNRPLITLLAEGPANTGPDFGKASPVGLLVIVLLLIGIFVLMWSMNRHLKRIPASFDTDDDGAAKSGAADQIPGRADTGETSREPGG